MIYIHATESEPIPPQGRWEDDFHEDHPKPAGWYFMEEGEKK